MTVSRRQTLPVMLNSLLFHNLSRVLILLMTGFQVESFVRLASRKSLK